MKSKTRISKPERDASPCESILHFGVRISSFFRHLAFVIRHFHPASFGLCFRFGGDDEISLIRKRGEHRDDGNADECADTIELVEAGEVVEEKFENGNAEQTQR